VVFLSLEYGRHKKIFLVCLPTVWGHITELGKHLWFHYFCGQSNAEIREIEKICLLIKMGVQVRTEQKIKMILFSIGDCKNDYLWEVVTGCSSTWRDKKFFSMIDCDYMGKNLKKTQYETLVDRNILFGDSLSHTLMAARHYGNNELVDFCY
jgi:hypothetical protein